MSDCSVISGITLIMWLRLQFAFFNCIFTHSEVHRSSSDSVILTNTHT